MSARKLTFTNGEIYHVYNRGVEKREIFIEISDYFRMVNDFYELNDRNATFNSQYSSRRNPGKQCQKATREILVEILAFVLMPNHYHLVLRQVVEDGIMKFMQKLGTGYAVYFNKKYDRVGSLFQGRFKVTHIDTDDYMGNLVGYIHTNPIDLIPNYRGPASRAMEYLEKYRWSSFLDYIGINNFPLITNRDFIIEMMGGGEGVKSSVNAWLTYREDKRGTVPEIIEAGPR